MKTDTATRIKVESANRLRDALSGMFSGAFSNAHRADITLRMGLVAGAAGEVRA